MLLRVCEREGFEVPFLQIFNVHRGSNEDAGVIRSIATSEEFGRMAADLLGVDAVMLYQTAAFYKEAGHGETAWHSDLNTAPFDTNDMVTFWLALTDVPGEPPSPPASPLSVSTSTSLHLWPVLHNQLHPDCGPPSSSVLCVFVEIPKCFF